MNHNGAEAVTLRDVLNNREARAAKQLELLRQYGMPLLCVTMNIAGPVKRSGLIDLAFQEAVRALWDRLGPAILHETLWDRATGREAFLVCGLPAAELKQIAVGLENARPVGRLYDLDVIGTDGGKLSRPDPRTCLVCGGLAGPCARSRAHGLEAVQHAANALLRDFAADTLADLAVRTLVDEVELTPKPGLVDRNNSGAHRDMDLEMFRRSAQSLGPYFRQAVELGMACEACMPQLQRAGLAAEQAMLAATGGVNTHRGAVYAFGLTLAALGSCLCRGGDVFRTAAALAESGQPGDRQTHGGRAVELYGVPGARGEAMAGFPHARQACGVLEERGMLPALLTLLAEVDDTNLLHRGGRSGLLFVQEQAREILAGPEEAYPGQLEALDRVCIARNLSPGGCADLLALGMLLDRTREIWDG